LLERGQTAQKSAIGGQPMARNLAGAACILVIFILVQSQIRNLMTLPDPNAPDKPKTWFLVPLPKAQKPDPQMIAAQKANKKIEQQANLFKPFAKPHLFEDAESGYKIVFPGPPHQPQFYYINRNGTTWYYEEERLGKLRFSMDWDKIQMPYDPQPEAQLLASRRKYYQEHMEKRHGEQKGWMEKVRDFNFQNRCLACEVVDYYHFNADDDYYGQQMCRNVMIINGLDLYQISVEGNAEVVNSKLADDFFRSFELIPKVPNADWRITEIRR
jgi:hypothetical protein